MGFSQISKSLAVAAAPRKFVFDRIVVSPDGKPVEIMATHAGDGTRGYAREVWKEVAERAGQRQRKLNKRVVFDSALSMARRIADHCVKSWANVYEDGSTTPAPCTPDKVYELFETILEAPDGLEIWGEFRAWIAEADNFRDAPLIDPVDVGKE